MVTKEKSGKTTKIVFSTKEKYHTTKKVLVIRDGKLLCKKRVMVKAGIPPSISKETFGRVLQKTDGLEMDSFLEKSNPDQK